MQWSIYDDKPAKLQINIILYHKASLHHDLERPGEVQQYENQGYARLSVIVLHRHHTHPVASV